MSHEERILDHLGKKKSISGLEAIDLFGCYRLAARIHDLREAGHAIETNTITGTNRYGQPYRFATYTMAAKRLSAADQPR